jgi:hypothetical protein
VYEQSISTKTLTGITKELVMDACKLSIEIRWALQFNFLQSIAAAQSLDKMLTEAGYGTVLHDLRPGLQWHFMYRPSRGGTWTVDIQDENLKDKAVLMITNSGFAVVSESP